MLLFKSGLVWLILWSVGLILLTSSFSSPDHDPDFEFGVVIDLNTCHFKGASDMVLSQNTIYFYPLGDDVIRDSIIAYCTRLGDGYYASSNWITFIHSDAFSIINFRNVIRLNYEASNSKVHQRYHVVEDFRSKHLELDSVLVPSSHNTLYKYYIGKASLSFR